MWFFGCDAAGAFFNEAWCAFDKIAMLYLNKYIETTTIDYLLKLMRFFGCLVACVVFHKVCVFFKGCVEI